MDAYSVYATSETYHVDAICPGSHIQLVTLHYKQLENYPHTKFVTGVYYETSDCRRLFKGGRGKIRVTRLIPKFIANVYFVYRSIPDLLNQLLCDIIFVLKSDFIPTYIHFSNETRLPKDLGKNHLDNRPVFAIDVDNSPHGTFANGGHRIRNRNMFNYRLLDFAVEIEYASLVNSMTVINIDVLHACRKKQNKLNTKTYINGFIFIYV